MTELTADTFRTVGPGGAVPNDHVVPYYLEDRKARISIARVDGSPLRVRRHLHLRRRGMPALRRAARGDDDHVPVPRVAASTSRPAP